METITAKDIEELRKRYGLSREGLADRLGVSIASIYRWERGAKPNRIAVRAFIRLREELERGSSSQTPSESRAVVAA